MVTCSSSYKFDSCKRIYMVTCCPHGQMCYMVCFERHPTYYYTDSILLLNLLNLKIRFNLSVAIIGLKVIRLNIMTRLEINGSP